MVGWLAVCFAAAATGAIASAKAGAFYGQLTRPDWAPPSWLFAPVWTVLYGLMAVSVWLVWRTYGFGKGRSAIVLFVVQLATNAVWTWIFFAWHQGAIAFVEIVLLWCLIVATITSFWRLRRLAALMLVPYLAWVTFAALLTFSTWKLNSALL